MTRMRELLCVGGLRLAVAGCATHGAEPSASAGPAEAAKSTGQLTLDTPIAELCEDPRGRAVIDRDMPDLRDNPNYFLFKSMSLRQLASMSGGRITKDKLEKVRLDLAAASAPQNDTVGTR